MKSPEELDVFFQELEKRLLDDLEQMSEEEFYKYFSSVNDSQQE